MLSFVKVIQTAIPLATAFMRKEKLAQFIYLFFLFALSFSFNHCNLSFICDEFILTGKKLGDVGASFSDISRPLLFNLTPCALLDVADVLSAKYFDSIPAFSRKKGMPYI